MAKRNTKIRKLNKKRIFIFVIVFSILGIFLLQKRNNITTLEKFTKDIFLFPLNITSKVIPKKDPNLIDGNDLLKVENSELKKEINELKTNLEINDVLSDYVVERANIIERNLTYFFNTVTINKGSTSGITDNMAVVAGSILIGKTKNVSSYYSEVELLTSDKLGKISVKISNGDDNFVYGLLSGYNKEKNVYYVEGISKTVEVNTNTYVTTTGLGETFPSGILIGVVSNITTDHFDLSKTIEVTPSINMNDFTIVSVLKRNVNL